MRFFRQLIIVSSMIAAFAGLASLPIAMADPHTDTSVAVDQPPQATGGQNVPPAAVQTKASQAVSTYVQFTKEQTINLWAAHLHQSLADWRYSAPTTTACGGPMAVTGGEYCPHEQTIHLNETGISWNDAGRLGFIFFLGHEYGHHLQYLAAGNDWSVAKEQQANCASGAMVQWLMQAHPEYGITDDEVQYLEWYMGGSPGDAMHGSAEGLRSAFDTGYQSGLAACTSIAGPIAGA